MMCDFKPGDEVVCVDDRITDTAGQVFHILVRGETYVVADVAAYPGNLPALQDQPVVFLREVQNYCASSGCDIGFDPARFRKVQRLDLSAWLKTSVGNTDKLDKRQPKKVRA